MLSFDNDTCAMYSLRDGEIVEMTINKGKCKDESAEDDDIENTSGKNFPQMVQIHSLAIK